MSTLRIEKADARHLPLPDNSVQCVVTSPPYWGLRKYAGEQESVWEVGPAGIVRCDFQHDHDWGEMLEAAGGSGLQGETSQRKNRANVEEQEYQRERGCWCKLCGAWRGAFGLEPTIEMYVAHTVEILREVRRVLRQDGVCFWNLGDSYSTGGRIGHGTRTGYLQETNRGTPNDAYRPPCDEIKPKDMCLIPSRVALAAQVDGWWVRSMIVWAKPNPMPESVTDRPTDAYENIIMLTKSERYFWDGDSVREPTLTANRQREKGNGESAVDTKLRGFNSHCGTYADAGRNLRNVWTFPTQPYAGAHFATFPEELPRRCILAATSAKGACIKCGAPWERVTRKSVRFESGSGRAGTAAEDVAGKWNLANGENGNKGLALGPCVDIETIGWTPGCTCRNQHGRTVPCTVLDPFGGSGTTGRVAIELNREAILCDIAYDSEYGELAAMRTTNVQRNLL